MTRVVDALGIEVQRLSIDQQRFHQENVEIKAQITALDMHHTQLRGDTRSVVSQIAQSRPISPAPSMPGSGTPLQPPVYAAHAAHMRPQMPPEFDGTEFEEYLKRLETWEQYSHSLADKGHLVTGRLKGKPFQLVTDSLTLAQRSDPAGYRAVLQVLKQAYQRDSLARRTDVMKTLSEKRSASVPLEQFLREYQAAHQRAIIYKCAPPDALAGYNMCRCALISEQMFGLVLQAVRQETERISSDPSFEYWVRTVRVPSQNFERSNTNAPTPAFHAAIDEGSTEIDQNEVRDGLDDWYETEEDDRVALVTKAVVAALRVGAPPKRSGGKGRNKGKGKSDNSRKSEQCTHCERTGHNESKCWKKHPELAPSFHKRGQ